MNMSLDTQCNAAVSGIPQSVQYHHVVNLAFQNQAVTFVGLGKWLSNLSPLRVMVKEGTKTHTNI